MTSTLPLILDKLGRRYSGGMAQETEVLLVDRAGIPITLGLRTLAVVYKGKIGLKPIEDGKTISPVVEEITL